MTLCFFPLCSSFLSVALLSSFARSTLFLLLLSLSRLLENVIFRCRRLVAFDERIRSGETHADEDDFFLFVVTTECYKHTLR